MGAAHVGTMGTQDSRTLRFDEGRAKLGALTEGTSLWQSCMSCPAGKNQGHSMQDDSEDGMLAAALSNCRGCAARPRDARVDRMEAMLRELFAIQDLNSNGLLEESELIDLNIRIAQLHHGDDVDVQEVAEKYCRLFRLNLQPEGKPISFRKYRDYMRQVLTELDADMTSQEMIVEQFIAEATLARAVSQRQFGAISPVGFSPTRWPTLSLVGCT
eukprot:gb/GFBE01053472.1/.p1 GENE.gb/GFBE01053472.1/~~gb/GFBE01053472.1/.p1  ORF type:complete len:215 (+),score=44.10 gb/GFBE01053472.1/:1-645(+)